jgi:hypothetical protein
MNLPKNHHFWPVCHSKFWTGADGKVITYELGGTLSLDTPKRTARIEHLNSIRMANGTKNVWLEVYFDKEVEDKSAPALFKLAKAKNRNLTFENSFDRNMLRNDVKVIRKDGFAPPGKGYAVTLNEAERRTVARYVASMMVRVPSYKNQINSASVIASLHNDFGFQAEAAVEEADRLSVEILMKHMTEYADHLMKCTWFIAESTSTEFVFCDTPVIPSTLGWGEAEAVIPITPNRILVFIKGWKSPLPDQILVVGMLPHFVRSTNITLVQNAEQYVYSRGPISERFIFKHLGTRQIRVVPILQRTDHPALGKGVLFSKQGA